MLTRHFIHPNAPLAELSAEWFLNRFQDIISKTPADFSKILVIVPTRSAARNFRNALFASGKIESACGLKISTFEDALSRVEDKSNTISATQIKAMWMSVLESENLSLLRGLFPNVVPARKDFFNFVEELMSLQNSLLEGLLTINLAFEKLEKSTCYDVDRWRDLAFLERVFFEKLAKLNLKSLFETRIDNIKSLLDEDFEFVEVLGCPEVSTSLANFLKGVSDKKKQVDCLIFSEEKSGFDEFGVPNIDVFCNKTLSLKESDIIAARDIYAQADLVVNLAKCYGEDAYKVLGIACEQKESVGIFKSKLLEGAGINAMSLDMDSLEFTHSCGLIKAYGEFLKDSSFENFLNFIRNPYVLKKVEDISQKGADAIFKDLDTLFDNSCCTSFESAFSSWCKLVKSSLVKESKHKTGLEKSFYLNDIFRFINNIFPKIFDFEEVAKSVHSLFCTPENVDEEKVQTIFRDSVENIKKAQALSEFKFLESELFDIILSNIVSATKSQILEKEVLPLQDWLEIFWSEKPHIVLCDMNDGIVPLANSDGVFLNDSLRKILGLRTQDLRQARDAYMLETLFLSRFQDGMGIKVCYPFFNLKADNLMPSRLLFQCEKLPERVNYLFSEPSEANASAPYELEWNLDVPLKSLKRAFSVSILNDYINSPWLFYLKHVLNMRELDIFKKELGANQFGTLFHEVFKRFALSSVKDSTDEDEIRGALSSIYENLKAEIFPLEIRAQVRLQLENLRNRILSCAKIQAQHRANKWKILYAEKDFECEFCGFTFKGTFDRIDINEETGQYYILDYKTHNNTSCKKYHIKEHYLTKSYDWINLQLPLYRYFAKQIFDVTDIKCGHFTAPKSVLKTQIYEWEDIKSYEEDAVKFASEVIEKIKKKDFKICRAKSGYSDFGKLFTIDIEKLKDAVNFIEEDEKK